MSLRTLESDMRTNSTKMGRITWNCASTWQGQRAAFCVMLENNSAAHSSQYYPLYYPERSRKPKGIQRKRIKRIRAPEKRNKKESM